jgi:hypothetical protein
LAKCPAVFDRKILALAIAGFLQALMEASDERRKRIGRGAAEEPDHRHRLLCAHRQRPRRRAADKRDELAPPHSITTSASDSKLSRI